MQVNILVFIPMSLNADVLGPPVGHLEISGKSDILYNAKAFPTILDFL